MLYLENVQLILDTPNVLRSKGVCSRPTSEKRSERRHSIQCQVVVGKVIIWIPMRSWHRAVPMEG